MVHLLGERLRDDERPLEGVEERPVDFADREEVDRAEEERRLPVLALDLELDVLRAVDDPAWFAFDWDVPRGPAFDFADFADLADDEVFLADVLDDLRDVPLLRLFCRPSAVRRATSLLKLLLPPRASLSWTSSARLFSSKEANQSFHEIGWSLPAPL